MNTEKYKAFKNDVSNIQKGNMDRFRGEISDFYNFAEDDKTLIWNNKENVPLDIVLKVNQAADKHLL